MSTKTFFYLSSFLVIFNFIMVHAEKETPLAPALYVFGDSLSDSGNNNLLNTMAKANYKPYGIDFPFGPTGRFTNGKTLVDFIAEALRLPYLPAYSSLSNDEKSKVITGVNYASGAAGILPETGTALGDNFSFQEQIDNFESTITNDLPKNFIGQPNQLSQYISKSIIIVLIGSNDYINNYFQTGTYNSSSVYNPTDFANLLLNKLEQGLRRLYNIGVRKLVVFELGPIGCVPAIVNSANPKPRTPCVEDVNRIASLFNAGLHGKILKLRRLFVDSIFVQGNIYATSLATHLRPASFGFTQGLKICCIVGGNGTTTCLPNEEPCPDRTQHIYWDAFHPTEEINRGNARGCFSGRSPCVPINILQLAQK